MKVSPAKALVYVLAAVSLVLAAVALAGQWGRVDPAFDLINHFAPVWTAAAFLCLALWVLLGRNGRATPALAGIALAVGLWMCAPELARAFLRWPARPAGETLKVVQFNVWGGNREIAAAARWLIAEDADLVVLQEAGAASPRIWERVKDLYPYQGGCPDPRSCSVLILSKRPPLAQGYFTSPIPNSELGGWARYASPLGAYSVGAVHLHRPWPVGPQAVDLAQLPTQVSRLGTGSAILAGDFNATPWSLALRRFDGEVRLQRRSRSLFTWPTANRPERLGLSAPLLPIDHVYAGKAWRTVKVRRGPNLGSDHNPVVVILTRDGP